MYQFLLVAFGGAVGSGARFAFQKALNTTFPYGTILVNVIGCLLIGVVMGVLSKGMNEEKKLLLATGFCGGFTTFSAFSYEGVQMINENRWLLFIAYTSASVIGSLIATYIGFKITQP